MGSLLQAIISKNIKYWEDSLPFVEFAYNRVIHSTAHCYSFEVVYGFNPLTPLDLLSIPCNVFVSDAAINKVKLIKTLHKEVKERIEKNNSKVALRANKGIRELIFKSRDWVWVHF